VELNKLAENFPHLKSSTTQSHQSLSCQTESIEFEYAQTKKTKHYVKNKAETWRNGAIEAASSECRVKQSWRNNREK